MRRLSAWLVVVPLMLAATEFAHALAYRLVYPEAAVRFRVLAATGHGYMDWAPVFLGVGGALVLAGVLAAVVDTARRREVRPVPAWAFGLLPLVGFTLQEFLERWFVTGALPWWMVEQPTFRIGLLLQLPFALASFVLARVLLRVAERVGLVFGGFRTVVRLFGPCTAWRPLTTLPVRIAQLAAGHAERGPPTALRPSLSS